VVSARAVAHSAGGRLDLLAEAPDRMRLRIESDGGLAVVRRAYHPMWRARAENSELPVVPANLVLMGIEMPPGAHEVVLEISAQPEAAAGLVAGATVALLAVAGFATRSGGRPWSPGRGRARRPAPTKDREAVTA
jgi:hypothetical protein